ncbi:BPI-like_protein [Hexamita inflata]|uniref:BPI-like protein n=1 Tax=Hexamita inflata TaxID=28002 RepID=A0AA86PAZ1_9EUKA|nr:BPI-like protein [Hexamita inflata]
MLVCISHSLQSQCNLPNYPQVLIEEDSALLYSMNKQGIQQYLQCVIGQTTKFIQNSEYSFGDIEYYSPTLGAMLVIDNLTMLNINANETVVNFKSNNIEAHNINILFNFTWAIYKLNQFGTGELNYTGSDFQLNNLSYYQDPNCEGNLNRDSGKFIFKPNIFNVSIFGAAPSIKEELVREIIMICEGIIPDMMGILAFQQMFYFDDIQQNYQTYPKYPNIVKDDRFTSNMIVELNQLVFMKSGYTFSLDNLSDQFINSQMINALPVTRNNKQVEYTISKAALDNFLYIFHTYNDSYSNPSVFSVVEAPTMELSKNQVTLNLKVKIQDEEADLKLKGAPKLRTENDLTFLYFEFELEPEYYEVISWVNEQIKDACYLIKNEVFSLNGFSVVIDADNDCVKIVGDIAACL